MRILVCIKASQQALSRACPEHDILVWDFKTSPFVCFGKEVAQYIVGTAETLKHASIRSFLSKFSNTKVIQSPVDDFCLIDFLETDLGQKLNYEFNNPDGMSVIMHFTKTEEVEYFRSLGSNYDKLKCYGFTDFGFEEFVGFVNNQERLNIYELSKHVVVDSPEDFYIAEKFCDSVILANYKEKLKPALTYEELIKSWKL